jgi:hypothetical protein
MIGAILLETDIRGASYKFAASMRCRSNTLSVTDLGQPRCKPLRPTLLEKSVSPRGNVTQNVGICVYRPSADAGREVVAGERPLGRFSIYCE